MLHVNDNMDELFRRAAENYPLKTDNPDWDELKKKLQATPYKEPKKPFFTTGFFRNLIILLLLILLPLTFFLNKPVKKDQEKGTILSSATTERDDRLTTSQHENNAATSPDNDNNILPGSELQQTSPDNTVLPITRPQHNGRHDPSDENNSFASGNNPAVASVNKGKVKDIRTGSNSMRISSGMASDDNEVNAVSSVTDKNKRSRTSRGRQRMTVIAAAPQQVEDTLIREEDLIATVSQPRLNEPVVTPAGKNAMDTVTENSSTPAEPEEKKKDKQKQKRWYAGVVAGPDMTTVKMQPVKKTGISAGFIIGYEISNRWKAETGMILTRKYYETKGKYFNTSKMDLPSNYEILYASGNCDMWELPVNVQYHFAPGKKAHAYATAGMSSYFMKRESYKYDVLHNGYAYPVEMDYNTSSSQFLSVINLGGGFAYRIGRLNMLRIEPSVKIPVNKVGTGSLPLQSAGVLIGFTRKLF